MKLFKLDFLGGRGGEQNKNLPWGECGYFLELHIIISCFPFSLKLNNVHGQYLLLCLSLLIH